MIIIEGQTVPTGENNTVRPMTLEDCIESRNNLADLMDAEALIDILIAEIDRLHTQAERRSERLRELGFEELTEDQRAWNRLVNLGIGDKP